MREAFDLSAWIETPEIIEKLIDDWERESPKFMPTFQRLQRDVLRTQVRRGLVIVAAIVRGGIDDKVKEYVRSAVEMRIGQSIPVHELFSGLELLERLFRARLSAAVKDTAIRANAELKLIEAFSKYGRCAGAVIADVLEQTYRELSDRHAKIERLIADRDQFMGFLLHDLKNPIAAARINLETIAPKGDPDLQGAYEDVHTSIDRILKMANQLLDANQLEDGALPYRPEPIDLGDLVQKVANGWLPQTNERGVHLKIDASPGLQANADPDLVRRVVENFLENALRYTPKKGMIRVVARVDGPRVEIIVWDSGPPVSAELRDRIFDKYWHGQERGSRGLGLYFSRLVAQKHDGNAWTDEQEDGCAFHLTVPRRATIAPP